MNKGRADKIIIFSVVLTLFICCWVISYTIGYHEAEVFYGDGWQRTLILVEECEDCLDGYRHYISKYDHIVVNSRDAQILEHLNLELQTWNFKNNKTNWTRKCLAQKI